jgi:glucuronokinase
VTTVTGTAAARAALAGNPSDRHGGAVLALTLPALTATVTATAGPPGDEPALLRAARARFQGTDSPALQVTTNVPREVGLGGSSAIVTAALRALAAWHDTELEPLALARMALAAETEELGIHAGPQDRVAQAIGGLVFMDFSGDDWHAERLDVALPPLYVAWLTEAAAPSHEWHAAMRPEREVMATLAQLARDARAALCDGDHERFGRCVDGSLDARARLGPLDPRHAALAEAARACGATANFTGSGGAVVGTLPDAAFTARMRAAAPGCEILTLG